MNRPRAMLRAGFFALLLLPAAMISPSDAHAGDQVAIVRDVPYRDGPVKAWRLDLALKADLRGRPRPGIVVIHGGGWIEGDKSSFVFRDRRAPANIVDFARQGFVAVSLLSFRRGSPRCARRGRRSGACR